jgi:hypothetical protein
LWVLGKEMPVIPANKVVDKKGIIGKGAEEEDKHLGSLIPTPPKKFYGFIVLKRISPITIFQINFATSDNAIKIARKLFSLNGCSRN